MPPLSFQLKSRLFKGKLATTIILLLCRKIHLEHFKVFLDEPCWNAEVLRASSCVLDPHWYFEFGISDN